MRIRLFQNKLVEAGNYQMEIKNRLSPFLNLAMGVSGERPKNQKDLDKKFEELKESLANLQNFADELVVICRGIVAEEDRRKNKFSFFRKLQIWKD